MRALCLLLLSAGLATAEPGLVGWWSFGQSDGVTVRDASGGGRDGRIELATLVAEPGGKVLALDDIGAGVQIGRASCRERV